MKNKNKCIWQEDGRCNFKLNNCKGVCDHYRESLKALKGTCHYNRSVWNFFDSYTSKKGLNGIKEVFTGEPEDIERFIQAFKSEKLKDVSVEVRELTLALSFLESKPVNSKSLFSVLLKLGKSNIMYYISPYLIDKACRLYNSLFLGEGDPFFRLKFFEETGSWLIVRIKKEYFSEADC